jgi:hypothetical protein
MVCQDELARLCSPAQRQKVACPDDRNGLDLQQEIGDKTGKNQSDSAAESISSSVGLSNNQAAVFCV